MNNRDVAHRWANQTQAKGKGSNFFFGGPSIYSYGRHFEVARIIPDKKVNGAPVVLFTTRDYSVTTSKHKSYARGALSSERAVFYAPRLDAAQYPIWHVENVARYLADAKEAHEKARKALAWGKLYGRREQAYIQAGAAYLAVFARRIPKGAGVKELKELRALIRKEKAGKLWSAAEMAQFDAREERAKLVGEKRRANQSIKWARRSQEYLGSQMAGEIDARLTLDAWVKGDTDALPAYQWESVLPTLIRIKDKRIETSRGAQITLRAAVGLWNALTGAAAIPLIGMDLDGYTVNAWDGAVLTVGCHKIAAAELVKLAAVLGLKGSLTAPAATAAGAAQ